MTLNEFIETAVASDRLLVKDSQGNELYRGFTDCLQYQGVDGKRKVKKHGLATEIYTSINMKKGISVWKELGERVPEENTSLYKYSDLQMMIFIEVVLEG